MTVKFHVFFFTVVKPLKLVGVDKLSVVDEVFVASARGHVSQVSLDSIHVVDAYIQVSKLLQKKIADVFEDEAKFGNDSILKKARREEVIHSKEANCYPLNVFLLLGNQPQKLRLGVIESSDRRKCYEHIHSLFEVVLFH